MRDSSSYRRACSALALAAVLGCSRDEPKPAKHEPRQPAAEQPRYPVIDPASVTPLDVLYFPEPVGEGYPKVPIEFGPSLHSGKWLGLANGNAQFIGPNHIIVNHFRSRPDYIGEGDLAKSVVLNVETGEAVAEFERGRYVQGHWGLAIVYQKGDKRPYLLDVSTGEFVLAIPEGKHEYVIGDNYWLRFSPMARRVWVYAQDKKGTVHLYAWENFSIPPELPNNPFPFLPEYWDPLGSYGYDEAGTEEVWPKNELEYDCSRAILKPPKGYECLDDGDDLIDTVPLSDGWRLDHTNSWVFNRSEGRGFDLSKLCGDAQPTYTKVLRRAPAQVEVTCKEDPSVWMLWTPPDRVQQLDPKYAVDLNKGNLWTQYHHDLGQFELWGRSQPGVDTVLDRWTRMRELIGNDYECPQTRIRPGGRGVFGTSCWTEGGRLMWFELTDTRQKIRSRFRAMEVVVGPEGIAVSIIRRGNRDHVVRLHQTSR